MKTTTNITNSLTRQAIGALGAALAIMLLSVTVNAAAQTSRPQSPGYSRESIRAEQRVYGIQLARAETEVKAAQERLANGLPTLAERNLILALLVLDAASVRMQGHEDRVGALRSAALAYSREKQVQLLLATCTDLRAQERRLEDTVHELRTRQPSGVTNTWKSLPLYLNQRADFARRFKDQSLSPDDLIGDVELLQDYPLSLVLGGLINSKNHRAWTRSGEGIWRSPAGIEFLADGSLKPVNTATSIISLKQKPATDKAASALKKLEQKTSELDQAVSQIRREQSNLMTGLATRQKESPKEVPAMVVPVGNSVIRSEGPMPIQPPLQAASNEVARIAAPRPVEMPAANLPVAEARNPDAVPRASITNSQTSPLPNSSVNRSASTAQPTSATIETARIAESSAQIGPTVDLATGSKPDAAPLVVTIEPQRARLSPLILGVVGVLVLAGVVALVVMFATGRQGEFEMTLACGTEGREETVTLTFDKNDQCVLLHEEKPALETRGAEGEFPCIVVKSFGGPQLCPGTSAQIRLNGEGLSTRRRLGVGDVIEVQMPDRCARVVFHGGNFVSADEQGSALQSATIN